MNFYPVVFYIFVSLFLVVSVANRIRQLRKVIGWLPIKGTIVSSDHKLRGEAAELYIDVKYTVDGIDRYGFRLDTHSSGSKGFEIGQEVKILINPFQPSDCCVATSMLGDEILRYLFNISTTANSSGPPHN